ncbi:MAG: hypothetical protein JWM80_4016 [Cyanobacteria bacterium RYN_339]|nr:hypothetical protein [Cyanobacteria bacterium RYN_339]
MESAKRSSLALALALLLGFAAPVQAALVDGVVAATGHEAIALSLFRAYHTAFWPDQPAAVAVRRLIDDRLVAAQARRYGQDLKPAELEAERKSHARPAGPTPEEWDRLIADRALAERFLAFRFGDFVPVTRDQEQAYFDKHRGDFPGTFDAAQPRIHAILVPQIRARRIDRFKTDLRDRADVRVNPGLLGL